MPELLKSYADHTDFCCRCCSVELLANKHGQVDFTVLPIPPLFAHYASHILYACMHRSRRRCDPNAVLLLISNSNERQPQRNNFPNKLDVSHLEFRLQFQSCDHNILWKYMSHALIYDITTGKKFINQVALHFHFDFDQCEKTDQS